MDDCFVRIKDVKAMTGLAVPTIYKWMARGKFPKNFRLTENSVGWSKAEIAAWQRARIQSREQGAAA